jgi:AcrR family transcriptional regulator
MGKSVDHAQRREIFAAAALRVIMRDGIAGLTVREVAKEAGFTTGALTHYFHSKDQLLIEASEHSALLVRARMERRRRPAGDGDPQGRGPRLPLTARPRLLAHLGRLLGAVELRRRGLARHAGCATTSGGAGWPGC